MHVTESPAATHCRLPQYKITKHGWTTQTICRGRKEHDAQYCKRELIQYFNEALAMENAAVDIIQMRLNETPIETARIVRGAMLMMPYGLIAYSVYA